MTGLVVPAWADTHTEEDAGIRWSRTADARVLPDFADAEVEVIKVEMYLYDRVQVLDGVVGLCRDDDVEIIAGAYRMTADQAVDFAEAILGLVATVAGTS